MGPGAGTAITGITFDRCWRERPMPRIAPVRTELTLGFIAENVLGLPLSFQ